MSRVGATAVTQIFTSVKNWVNSKLPTKVSDLTNDSGFITEHPSISTSTDTTSSASPSANGTFTCIDSVTRDTNGHVTKVNTKTVTLPNDTTYSGMTASEATTGTSTTNRLISPKVLEDKISEKISSLVDSAPSTLDTLNELASALGDDPNFATTVATQIGTKANDNAVVHTSGNEAISGNKTFSGNVSIYNSDASVDAKYLILKNQKVKRGSTTETGVQFITFQDKDGGTLVSYETNVLGSGNIQAYINVSNLDANSQRVVGGVKIIKTPTETWFTPDGDNTVSSGLSNYKWKSVYATNYYYGSNNVEFSTKFVTTDTAQEITNTKTFKDATTARKLTSVEAGNVIPSSDKLISDIWQDKNGKELGRIYYSKTKGGNTALIMRAGDYFSESEGVYSLNASGTNRRAELHLYSDSSGNCCIKPVGYFSAHIKPLNSSVYLGDSTKPFGRVYANSFQFCNAGLLANIDVQTSEEHSIGFFGQNNTPLSYITFQKRPSFKDRVAIRVQTSSSAYKSYDFDATCFYPESSNSVDIGSTTNIFKNIYCNNYYKGTSAFGDIVTHNASEFLTSHQSLANYVTTNTDQSISGTKTFGNGTLIVDNGIGNNVHGEIKLNGSRPGYIVADNASDGVFDNAGCGISILLQDAGKPLHIGAYKTDSNGRVFVDNTNKNPVLSITSGLIRTSTLVPKNDTGNSSFRILSQVDYANGDTSKLLDVRFVQYDNTNATSAVYSNDDNKTSLGISSKRWSSVYATNAYINNLILNGNAFDPASVSGNIGDIVFARAYYSAIDNLTMTAGGSALALIRIENEIYVEDRNNQSLSGTWKFLGSTIPSVTSGNASSTCAGVWKRIA